MSTQSICKKVFGRRARRTAPAVLLLLLCGCWYSGGEFLYLMGLGRAKRVEARFNLTTEPVLVFVDDYADRVDWPPARQYLTDQLSQELIRRGAARKVVPRQTLENLRRSLPDFAKLSCREVGEQAGAEQVIWLEVQAFLAEEQFSDPSSAAYFAVTVRIINALEKKHRSRVRLWPPSPAGHTVRGNLSGSAVLMAKTKDAISRELAHQLAAEIAKLFYDYRPGDFEAGK